MPSQLNPYAAPVPDQARTGPKPRKRLVWMWFGFDGRLSRFDYWVWGYLVRFVVFLALMMVIALAVGISEWVVGVLASLYGAAYLWSEIAILVKRAHDRDHSGWWVLWYLVPFMNVWVLVSVNFLAGTPGPNRFGPDPHGR